MYENKYKNTKTTAFTDLETFLQLLADLGVEIELFALGGTAMVLKGIKEATKDIDFLTTASPHTIRELFLLAGLKEGNTSQLCNTWFLRDIRIDIFYNQFILGFPLPSDWRLLSEHSRTIGQLKLFILNWYDIIITKVARSERRDIDDCLAIIKHEHIDFQKLKKRYFTYAETALISNFEYKFKHLEQRHTK
jgi:hypothetical protein